MSGTVLTRFGIVMLLGLVGGCAGLLRDVPPEEKVAERAQAWADALLAGDLKGAWAYTTPNYRSFTTPGQYNVEVAGATRWTDAQVDKVTCAEEVCEVVIMIDYEIKRYGVKNRRPLKYKWLKIDGKWWLYVSGKPPAL